jgi:hypothetical protein
MAVRDDPAALVYAIEAATVDHQARHFDTWAAVREWVDGVVASTWWTDDVPRDFGVETPAEVAIVQRGHRSTFSAAELDRPVLHVARQHWNTAALLHELAHLAAPDDAHGPLFRGVLLDGVRRWQSFHAYVELADGFRDAALDWVVAQ